MSSQNYITSTHLPQIIHEYKNILYSDSVCLKIFPEGSIIPSNTLCSVVDVKKSKPKKQTNKKLVKVWFAYYVTLYWDF